MVVHGILALRYVEQTPRDVREGRVRGYRVVCKCGDATAIAKTPKDAYILYSDHRKAVWVAAQRPA